MEMNRINELTRLLSEEVTRQSSNPDSQRPQVTSPVSFNDAVELELYRRSARNQSDKTIHHFKSSMRKFYNFVVLKGLMNNLEAVTVEDVEQFIVELRREGLSSGTINGHITNVRMLFKTLVQRERIEKDPTRYVVLESIIKKKRRVLSFEEIRDVMLSFDLNKITHFIGLCIFTLQNDIGCRVSELSMMKVEDLDLDKLQITYYARKNKVEVTTPISPLTGLMFRVYIKNILREKRRGYLFVRTDYYGKVITGKPLSEEQIRRIYREAGERAGLDFILNTHMIRRTKITTHLSNGGDLASAKELVGHKDIRSTMEYVHFTDENLREKHVQYGTFGRRGQNE